MGTLLNTHYSSLLTRLPSHESPRGKKGPMQPVSLKFTQRRQTSKNDLKWKDFAAQPITRRRLRIYHHGDTPGY